MDLWKGVRGFLIVSLVAIFTACSGSGGSNTPSTPVSKKSQSISFADAGPLTKNVNVSFSYRLSDEGAGTGAIRYTSSNISVATVDDNGSVMPLTEGRITITATKAEDAKYNEDTASYELIVIEGDFSFAAWVGTDKTTVLFDSDVAGLTFVSSPNLDEDPETNGELEEKFLQSKNVSTANATLDQDALFWLKKNDEGFSKPSKITIGSYPARTNHGGTVSDSASAGKKMWIVGGRSNNEIFKDVWSSQDGLGWELVTDNPEFPALYKHQVAWFKDKLWVIGGKTGPDPSNVSGKVWVSGDGKSWTESIPLETAVYGHRVAVFNGKLWVVGGRDSAGNYIDKVYTIDDVDGSWELQGEAIFPERSDHSLFVFDDMLWLSGGINASRDLADLWRYDVSRGWEQEVQGSFGTRFGHQMVTLGNYVYLVGGQSGDATLNDVLRSEDGISWDIVADPSPFSRRSGFLALSYDGQIWCTGGGNFLNSDGTTTLVNLRNDTWRSMDGSSWIQSTIDGSIPNRKGHASTEFKGQIWSLGGHDGVKATNEVWKSSDGLRWTRVETADVFPARFNHGVVVFDNRMWVVGGENSSGEKSDDVWSSIDGLHWEEHLKIDGEDRFTPRSMPQVVSFDDKLWVIGGLDSASEALSDVWSSGDGINWKEKTSNAGFSGTKGLQVVVFKKDGVDHLWAIVSGDSGCDVWTSGDGIDWHSEESNILGEVTKEGLCAAVLDSEIFLVGGVNGDGTTYDPGVYRYTKAETGWQRISSGIDGKPIPFEGRKFPSVAVYNKALYMMGGENGSGLLRDTWQTPDGSSWLRGYQDTIHFDTETVDP